MSFRTRIAGAWSSLTGKGEGWTMRNVTSAEELREALAGGPPSKSGFSPTIENALKVTDVLAAVTRIAFGFAQVPWKLFKDRKDGKGKDEARDHPLWKILYLRPNEWQTSFQFRVTMIFHLLLLGRFVAFKNVTATGEILELLPLRRARVARKKGTFDLEFFLTGDDGTERPLDPKYVWYVPGVTLEGGESLEWLKLAREAVGLSVAAQDNQTEMQQRGGRISGVLALEGNVDKASYKDLSGWVRNQVQKDLAETGVMLIDRAGKFYPATMTGSDQQAIETRKYQAEEICRHFGLFPEMIGLGSSTGLASVEQKGIWHVTHTLDPHWVNVEQSAMVFLLTEDEQKDMSVRFIRAGMMRGSTLDQFNAFAIALGRGATGPGQSWMTQNDVRDLLEMNPVEGGDKLSDPTVALASPNQPPKDEPKKEDEQ